jgi:hypothetical protein
MLGHASAVVHATTRWRRLIGGPAAKRPAAKRGHVERTRLSEAKPLI